MKDLVNQLTIDWVHWWELLVNWYWLPLFIFYIGVMSTILIENRNPSKTVSWIMVIFFIPFLGLLLYYLFGQKFRKVRRFQRINRLQFKKIQKAWNDNLLFMSAQIPRMTNRIGGLVRVFEYVKNQHLSPFSNNNKISLLTNGEEKFPLFIADLQAAKEFIHLEYYIFEMDTIGTQVMDILLQKASQGVEVRVILDSFGSPAALRYLKKQHNLQLAYQAFLPVSFSSLANSNYRNHRKIVVVDGNVGYIGGINISDRYINKEGADTLYWRDTSIRLEGEGVNSLQIQFWNSWNQTAGAPFMLSEKYLKIWESCAETSNDAFTLVSSDPGSRSPFNLEALLIAIAEAKESIQVCTPYFIPPDELSMALQLAAASGIQVELMIPASSDSYIVYHASFSYLKPLLMRGVSVHLYKKGFLHAKTICIDRKLAFVGTVNLDIRSFYINFEIAAVFSDIKVCERLAQQFERDKEQSEIVTLYIWMHRKKWKRALDSLCRLLAPLL